jgi:hypothetical protein
MVLRVGSLAVLGEDREDGDGAFAVGPNSVGGHGGELGCVAGLDEDETITEAKLSGTGEHSEPVATWVDAGVLDRRGRGSDAHLGDSEVVGGAFVCQRPDRHAPVFVLIRPDDNVLVVRGLDELVESGIEGPGNGDELVERYAARPGLNTAQVRGTQVASLRQSIQRPTSRFPQCSYSLANESVHIGFLLRRQECMSLEHKARKIEE